MPGLPSLFVSHGAPTFALEPGLAGAQLGALGKQLPRPEAVLVVSPHWLTATPRVAAVAQPATIHDFGGFDPALYEIQYPAPGHAPLAHRAAGLLQAAGCPAQVDLARGLDHGAWVPLLHLYPKAEVPVFQVSLPARLDAGSAWSLGRWLAPLADEGVLIVGSGSLTHNLHDYRQQHDPVQPYVEPFVEWVREAVAAGDRERLMRTLDDAPQARRAHPTAEHFWPLLVAAGASRAPRTSRLIEGGVAHGALSMDSFLFGMA